MSSPSWDDLPELEEYREPDPAHPPWSIPPNLPPGMQHSYHYPHPSWATQMSSPYDTLAHSARGASMHQNPLSQYSFVQMRSSDYDQPSSVSPYWSLPTSNNNSRAATAQAPWNILAQATPHAPDYIIALSSPSPPPQITHHKVYRLHCSSCNVLFTNRGMKACLLLRPSVSLYSTDAMPVNCSAPPRPPLYRDKDPPIPRTCSCLTQTLCCHGCGNICGYFIVIPCARCSSSISQNYNNANGHRFVFHHSETSAVERLYIQGEEDVIPFHPTHLNTVPHSATFQNPVESTEDHDLLNPSTMPTELSFVSEDEYDEDEGDFKFPSPSASPARPQVRLSGNRSSSRGHPENSSRRRNTRAQLAPGENVWWHNLTQVGDLPGVNGNSRNGGEDPLVRLRQELDCLR